MFNRMDHFYIPVVRLLQSVFLLKLFFINFMYLVFLAGNVSLSLPVDGK